mmetsp:Transcript_21947/g.48526  ORF Transcript_21947/g.48526 Transcript_21947/m.48526 type:complete len:1130 (+) Transcript_21947:41-3430(+)
MAEAPAQEGSEDLDRQSAVASENHDSEASMGENAPVEEPVVDTRPMMAAVLSDAEVCEVGREEGINVASFEILKMDPIVVAKAQEGWSAFLSAHTSREAVGEAIYSALFEGAPSLQPLFTTPRAVQAMRFMNGIHGFVTTLDDPVTLKTMVETLGFGHLNLDVTIPRVIMFRDALLDLLEVELLGTLDPEGLQGFRLLLNYVGGAIIFIKAHYADRLRLLSESWSIANGGNNSQGTQQNVDSSVQQFKKEMNASSASKKKKWNFGGQRNNEGDAVSGERQQTNTGKQTTDTMAQNVPTTYTEMFMFNAAVMGIGQNQWMIEVLSCFDNMVKNVANSARLQEECDVLVLRISRIQTGKVHLQEYKACMLASLRSLLPKDWSTAHEVAWSWLWENVERLLHKTMGNPPAWEAALAKFLGSLDESQAFEVRKQIYAKFFMSTPAGQDYFKQSNTYLHLIATKIMDMTMELYREPVKMVDDISALGLRHVGYAIPTELMGPFVSACIEVAQGVTQDEVAIEAFRWSLGLISKSLVRTILEGSTIVMKAINANNKKQMKKAIGCAPRGERATWMLTVQVGTQSISPLAWSVESGGLEAAGAIIQDLLTIRADRDRYYYGADELFARHPDIIHKLINHAPALLPDLMDGLVWRSRVTTNGMRRVNYYVKHLLVDPEGNFAPTLEWVARSQDPRVVCHPVLVLVADLVWSRIACRSFLYRKAWMIFMLILFVLSQSVLEQANQQSPKEHLRIMIFACRACIYLFSMGSLVYTHVGNTLRGYWKKDTVKVWGFVPVPEYLTNWQEAAGLVLTLNLIVMLASEPILHCYGTTSMIDESGQTIDLGLFTEECPDFHLRSFPYAVFSMLCMFLYFVLLVDLAVMNTRVSAFVLVCGRMMSEVALFFLALFITILMFSSAVGCLRSDDPHFQGLHEGGLSFFRMFMRMYSSKDYEALEEEPLILILVFTFLLSSLIFLLNMLIAQLSRSYDAVYGDMVGYARLKRINIIVETMPTVAHRRWTEFINSLNFEQRLEFNEGDVGLSGGLQLTELASANPTTTDMIRRFGGSTSPTIQWPEEDTIDDSDKYERLEKHIQRAYNRMTKGNRRRNGKVGSSNRSGSQNSEGEDKSGAIGSTGSEGG